MTQELLEKEVFAELCETMGTEFAAELARSFMEDAPNMLAELERACVDQEADAYRRAAHSIKSNAQIFGAVALATQARDIELADMTANSAASVGVLLATYERTEKALKGLLDE